MPHIVLGIIQMPFNPLNHNPCHSMAIPIGELMVLTSLQNKLSKMVGRTIYTMLVH